MGITAAAQKLFDTPIETLKRCTECRQEKPLSMFAKDSGANYHKGKCKPCVKSHNNQLKLLKKQHPKPTNDNYACPICNRTAQDMLAAGHKVRWCLDHDHTTGNFRGYICNTCNMGIANLMEDAKILQNAIDYLKADNERTMD